MIKEVQNAAQTYRGVIKFRLGMLEKAFQEKMTSNLKSEGEKIKSEVGMGLRSGPG